ncbi:hypothetical protein M9H77_08132 [Catharanthus roseus]|uniref:Uncharacterized protein n=1 Tax=Catharanthus roseus TaxID=4058 RepID=A0ACC0BWV3_CATRO|nr:hypothetical protein M9H77_08132 [Catharanthus roseus]
MYRGRETESRNLLSSVTDSIKVVSELKLPFFGDHFLYLLRPWKRRQHAVAPVESNESFNDVKFAIKYGQDDLTLSDVKSALKSKDLDFYEKKANQAMRTFM